MSTHSREATDDYSKEIRTRTEGQKPLGALGTAAAGLGIAGAVLAIVATFTVVIEIVVLTVPKEQYTGFDRTSFALVVLGVAGLLMVAGALRGARPAMAALALIGLAILLITIIHDLPHINDEGVWPENDLYEEARASPGLGYYFETASGILMLLSGVTMLLLSPGSRAKPPATREERQAARTRAAVPASPAPAPPLPRDEPHTSPPMGRSTSKSVTDDWFEPDAPRPAPPEPAPSTRRRRQGGLVSRLRKRDG